MNVSEQPNSSPLLLFIHVPKAGGMSLSSLIEANYDSCYKVQWHPDDPRHFSAIMARASSDEFCDFDAVLGHHPYGLHTILPKGRQYQYLTLVREPVSRTVSSFNYLRRDSSYVKRNPDLSKHLRSITLSDFLSDYDSTIPNHIYIDNCEVRFLSGAGDSVAFGDIGRTHLEQAIDNLATIQFGILEHFDLSLLLMKELRLLDRITYFPRNRGSGPRLVLDGADRQLLEERNRYDLQLYRYMLRVFEAKTSHISKWQLSRFEARLAIDRNRKRIVRRLRSIIRGWKS